ncbi:MAG TPA: hypothetical protein VM029_02900, partial [Opitutaceae bacterium]|nr:hypothetical protein [Opitutaceae bacterium]
MTRGRHIGRSIACLVLLFAADAHAAATLPNTAPLAWPETDLSARVMDGAHDFVERKITEAPAGRAALWHRDVSSPDAYVKSIEPNRERFRVIIGVVDPRLPPAMEQYGDDANPALVAENDRFRILQVRWPVLTGLWGSGLLLQPKTAPRAHVVVVPDAAETPEQVANLPAVRRLVENGCEVIIPLTISSARIATDDAALRRSDQTYREWIYRQAFHMGRHIIGYEVQIVLGAIDWFKAQRGAAATIGVAGWAEGGLVAFYAAAVDPRIDAALVSGYFGLRQRVWAEPIYRNVWSLLREFGDAEIASLVLPRGLVIEHSRVTDITDHKGERHTPALEEVRQEIRRARDMGGVPARPNLVFGGESGVKPYSDPAVEIFARRLGLEERSGGFQPANAIPNDLRRLEAAAPLAGARHARLFAELEGHVQLLVRQSDRVRDKSFLHALLPELADTRWSTNRRHPLLSAEKFVEGAKGFR